MIYVDYQFKLTDGAIAFDPELHLINQSKKPDQVWGKLPAGWKEGDMFKLTLIDDNVVLIKQPNE